MLSIFLPEFVMANIRKKEERKRETQAVSVQ